MKFGIFSDIHSNLEALEVVLDSLGKEGVDRYIFLGDLVGYGADPQPCIHLVQELIKEKGCRAVAGNHDYAVCGKTETESFVGYARDSIEWTRQNLNNGDVEFLAGLPLVEHTENITAVHANLVRPQDWGYIFDIDDAFASFKFLEDQICFIGHSHRPIIFTAGTMVDWFVGDRVDVQKDTKYIVNIGSVGQPRDGDPRASFAIYDVESSVIEIRRVRYDIKKTQDKIIKAGLPEILADRLAVGK